MTNTQLLGLVGVNEELRRANLAEVNRLLQARAGAELLTVITRTIPEMRKKGNPYHGRILKVSKVNGQIRFNYEAGVQRQQEREGKEANFEAQPRKWGTHVSPHSTFLAHVTKEGFQRFYLRLRVLRSKSVYVDENGAVIDPELIKPFLPVQPPSKQGVESEVIERDYNLDNILALSIAGEKLLIER